MLRFLHEKNKDIIMSKLHKTTTRYSNRNSFGNHLSELPS